MSNAHVASDSTGQSHGVAVDGQATDRPVQHCLFHLQFFVEDAKDQHSFAACLFTCQGLVGFHTALEMAWLHQEALPGILTLCMPFFVACIREYTGKVRCCCGANEAVIVLPSMRHSLMYAQFLLALSEDPPSRTHRQCTCKVHI